jgi:indolepyruvate ferredoxin oxidoreductase alpha subunit
MADITIDEPGKRLLMMGNEAIARGAIEAGVKYCAAYPGSPSSEIIETLARTDVAAAFGVHSEWSTNEIVAIESAAGASFSGLRALCAMKQNGINVAADFLLAVAYSGSKAGLAVVVADDPGSHCSNNEMDWRGYVRFLDLPLLEPSSIEEANQMVRWAFDVSEDIGLPCLVRTVTRISHARGDITLGEIQRPDAKPEMGEWTRFLGLGPDSHQALHERLQEASKKFEDSPFNRYEGPADAKLVIVACSMGYAYAREALKILGLQDQVGILKVGTTWPLPKKFILENLKAAEQVLFVEETDPFLEHNVKALLANHVGKDLKLIEFMGKDTGHVQSRYGPGIGELDPDIVLKSVASVKGIEYQPLDPEYASKAESLLDNYTAGRDLAFCAGCPHRASYWVMKNALELDGRGGFVLGDIGCYSMGAGRSGFFINRTLHCMGSGVGVACGMGNLWRFGFEQPVLAVAGDSTFFHACLPAMVSARYNGARFTAVVLDNAATAMTGFQPHPGIGTDAGGNPATKLDIEQVCKGFGFQVEVCDPYEVDQAAETLYDLMQQEESNVLILRRTCGLVESRKKKKDRVHVDSEKCIGTDCGCNQFCIRVYGCPALIWNEGDQRAMVDEVVCTGCGVCSALCPKDAILVEEARS